MDGDLLFNQTIGMNNSQITLQVRNLRNYDDDYRLRRVMERNAPVVGSINLLCNLRVICHTFVNDAALFCLLNKNTGLDIVCCETK